MSQTNTNVKALWPLLLVVDIERSIQFYRDQLGFDLVATAQSDGGKTFWCRLTRGPVSLMLQQAAPEDGPGKDRGRGVSLYFVCTNVDHLYDEFRDKGLAIAPPADTYYGMRQLAVPEPDGFQLCFEHEIPAAEPPGTSDGGESE